MKTFEFDGGKYAFDIDDYGVMVDARRHGEHWASGLESFRYSKVFSAVLSELESLRAEVARLNEALRISEAQLSKVESDVMQYRAGEEGET